MADAAFAAGAPFDEPSKCWALLVLSAVGAGGAFAGDGDLRDAEVVQVALDAGLAVASVGGDGAGNSAGALVDTADRRLQLRSVGRVALFDVVIENDAVGVVDNLGLVAELDGSVDAALADRSGVRVVQADQTCRRVGLAAIEPNTGWALTCAGRWRRVSSSLTARTSRPRPGAPADTLQRTARVADHRGRFGGGLIYQLGEFSDDPGHEWFNEDDKAKHLTGDDKTWYLETAKNDKGYYTPT